MKIKYTKSELITLLNTTGNITYWFERLETNNDHFLVDITSDINYDTDNLTHTTIFKLTIQFATKKAQRKLSQNEFMKENFKSNMTTSYSDDMGWYYAIYETDLIISDYS